MVDRPEVQIDGLEAAKGALDPSKALVGADHLLGRQALDAHRAADRLRQQRGVDSGIAGIVAPIRTWSRDPDPVHLGLRQPQNAGDPVAGEMRLLRAGPQGRPIGARDDDSAGRTHATSGTR
jgi:hypothetical protein